MGSTEPLADCKVAGCPKLPAPLKIVHWLLVSKIVLVQTLLNVPMLPPCSLAFYPFLPETPCGGLLQFYRLSSREIKWVFPERQISDRREFIFSDKSQYVCGSPLVIYQFLTQYLHAQHIHSFAFGNGKTFYLANKVSSW